MNDILMTNIFFLITGISSLITTILLVLVLVYLIKFIKKINSITEKVGDETSKIISDVDDVRVAVKEHVGVIRGVAGAALIKKIVEKIFSSK